MTLPNRNRAPQQFGKFWVGMRVRLSQNYFEVYGGCEQAYGTVSAVQRAQNRDRAKGVHVIFDGNTSGVPARYHPDLLEPVEDEPLGFGFAG